jgi:toxin-antitoxin system PIN domain toxin
VVVAAHRADATNHASIRSWLERLIHGQATFGVPSIVLSGFLRIVTHPRIFTEPATLHQALAFTEVIRSRASFVEVSPGPRHWSIFTSLCEAADARGNRVPDAYLAALAIESGSEWVTLDRGFARFPDLRWRLPGAEAGGAAP